MYFLASLAVVLVPLASALPAPEPVAAGGSTGGKPWSTCLNDLSCSFGTIQAAPLKDRLAYVRDMQSKFFGPKLNCPTQWRNIEGVIQFFMDNGLGNTNTWVSYTDAGIVEAVQRGGAIALGMSKDSGGNPGSQLWADFMNDMKAGKLNNRADHDKAWSLAEQAGTDYGSQIGKNQGLQPDQHTARWFQFTQVYRGLMRNEALIDNIFTVIGFFIFPPGLSVPSFINWFFDVTNPKPAYCGGSAAWDASGLDGLNLNPGNIINNIEVLTLLLPKFVQCYLQNT